MRSRALLPLVLLSGACAPARGPGLLPGGRPVPPRPPGCLEVPAGAALQPALDGAPDGAALCLRPGLYSGPVRLGRGQILWGPREAVIRSTGQGTTVRLSGKGTRILGLTVDGSGGRYDKMDAAIQAEGEGILVEGVRVQRAVFGILLDRSRSSAVRDNEILGTGEPALGLRGDGIRFWEVKDSAIEGNIVQKSRDVVIRYTTRVRVRGNQVSGGRYGLHLMYSDENLLEDNRSVGNVVGAFVMYSRNVVVRRNLLAASSGAAGLGLGVKESGNLTVADNLILRNTIGAYLDTTPLHVGDGNLFSGNAFRLSDTGLVFHSSQRRNTFSRNSFRDNHVQVRVEGGGDAMGVTWDGNDFDDYAGYDLDRDGRGDVPYQLRSLSGQLTSRFPDLGFFRGTPALSLIDAISHVLPLFQPRTILVDPRPSTVEIQAEGPRAG